MRAACLLVGDVHLAEDLVQGALIRVWPHWGRVVAQGDPDAYVRKDLPSVRVVRAEAAVAGVERRVVAGDGVGAPQLDGTAGVDMRLQVRETLAALAPRQRAVLVLRYYLDLVRG